MDRSERERLRAGLRPQPPVRWLHPAQLIRTGAQVVLARVFGGFAARRETEAALPAEIYDLSRAESDFWLDYAADVGDGFDATYAVARSIAADTVPVQHDRRGEPAAPPHGDLLVLGGDETYPVASEHNYAVRTTGPYTAALPERGPGSPALLAVPGNHDWYDGLTSFLRTFCQGWLSDVPFGGSNEDGVRWVDPNRRTTAFVGGWRTLQSRSYFAAKLPHGWWLWGTDIQFDGYVDAPQIGYFVEAATHLGPEDNVILCTANPSWIDVEKSEAPTLADFLTRTLGEPADAVRLVCAGDRHHYARYVPDGDTGPAALLTCGGGGAYLSPTHQLLETVTFGQRRGEESHAATTFRRAATFPRPDESRRLATGFWRLPWRNPVLSALLGSLYAMLVWLLAASQSGDGLLDRLAGYAVTDTRLGPQSLPLLTAVLVVLASMIGLARPTRVLSARTVVGALHGMSHLLLGVALAYAVPAVDAGPLPVSVVVTVCVGLVGGAAGALLLATYLYLGQRWTEMHANELFAGLRIEDLKCYLRIRIGPDGATVYPIGLRTVPHRWLPADHGPLLDPAYAAVPEVVEEPFTVRPRGRRSVQTEDVVQPDDDTTYVAAGDRSDPRENPRHE